MQYFGGDVEGELGVKRTVTGLTFRRHCVGCDGVHFGGKGEAGFSGEIGGHKQTFVSLAARYPFEQLRYVHS